MEHKILKHKLARNKRSRNRWIYVQSISRTVSSGPLGCAALAPPSARARGSHARGTTREDFTLWEPSGSVSILPVGGDAASVCDGHAGVQVMEDLRSTAPVVIDRSTIYQY